MSEPDSALMVRETENYLDEVGEVKQVMKEKLLNYALETYSDIMLNGESDKDRKAAADSVVEMLGKKNKTGSMQANFNVNIPPEYFKRVFGEGLRAVTEIIDVTPTEVK